MLEHISKPAKELLNKIASKRIGETLEAIEKMGCSDEIKDAVKKKMWTLKDEAEIILEMGACNDEQDK